MLNLFKKRGLNCWISSIRRRQAAAGGQSTAKTYSPSKICSKDSPYQLSAKSVKRHDYKHKIRHFPP